MSNKPTKRQHRLRERTMTKSSNSGVNRVAVAAFVLVHLLGTQSAQSQEHASDAGSTAYESSTHVYKVADGHEIRADVYRPQGEDVKPALIWIHGGALIFGTREWLLPWQLQGYLDAGFVVVSIDYRLAPETKLPEIVEDLEDAYAWLRAHGPRLFKIDPDRVAVIGHSAGGYLTLIAGFRLIPRPKALVSFYGYGDVTGPWYSRPSAFYNETPAISREDALASVGDSVISRTPVEFSADGRPKFYFYCRQQGVWPREVTGHDPDEERAWFADYEPVRNVDVDYPATLLLHGKKDKDVPYEQSAMMAEALRRHEVPHELISNSEWGHVFDSSAEDEAVQEAFKRVLEFLKEHAE